MGMEIDYHGCIISETEVVFKIKLPPVRFAVKAWIAYNRNVEMIFAARKL
jgi:hypothetical protein